MPNVIKVSSATELHLTGISDGKAQFKEFYQGWETGNTVDTPAQANPEEVVAIYRASVK